MNETSAAMLNDTTAEAAGSFGNIIQHGGDVLILIKITIFFFQERVISPRYMAGLVKVKPMMVNGMPVL